MGKSTISMAIFNSYVCLQKGKWWTNQPFFSRRKNRVATSVPLEIHGQHRQRHTGDRLRDKVIYIHDIQYTHIYIYIYILYNIYIYIYCCIYIYANPLKIYHFLLLLMSKRVGNLLQKQSKYTITFKKMNTYSGQKAHHVLKETIWFKLQRSFPCLKKTPSFINCNFPSKRSMTAFKKQYPYKK